MMNQEIKQKWIEALRSGKYKQGKYHLKIVDESGEESFCCLGVLASLFGPVEPYQVYLAPNLQNETCLQKINQHKLSYMNDGSSDREYSFLQIADYIEAKL